MSVPNKDEFSFRQNSGCYSVWKKKELFPRVLICATQFGIVSWKFTAVMVFILSLTVTSPLMSDRSRKILRLFPSLLLRSASFICCTLLFAWHLVFLSSLLSLKIRYLLNHLAVCRPAHVSLTFLTSRSLSSLFSRLLFIYLKYLSSSCREIFRLDKLLTWKWHVPSARGGDKPAFFNTIDIYLLVIYDGVNVIINVKGSAATWWSLCDFYTTNAPDTRLLSHNLFTVLVWSFPKDTRTHTHHPSEQRQDAVVIFN